MVDGQRHEVEVARLRDFRRDEVLELLARLAAALDDGVDFLFCRDFLHHVAHGGIHEQVVALLVDVLLQLLREVTEHVGDGLRDMALVVGVEQRRDELLEAAVEEDGRAADAEEL